MLRLASPSPSIRTWAAQLEALSEPVRLRMLHLLEDRELSVTELAEALQLPQSTTSRHLRTLSDLGWVDHRAEGTAHLYRFRNGELPATLHALWSLLDAASGSWPEVAQDRERLERILLERRSDPRRIFSGLAPRWEEWRRELFGERFALEALAALLPETATIVDLGCGTGLLLERIAPYVQRAIGVDSSAEMLALARKRIEPFRSAELIEAPVERLPLADAAADAALLLLVLGHVAEPAAALAEACRIVRPGGRLVVVDVLAPELASSSDPRLGRGFSRESLETDLRAAGWKPTIFRNLPHERGTRGPALFLACASKPAASSNASSKQQNSFETERMKPS